MAVETRTELWDESLPGFGVRVSPQGDKTFFVMFRVNGQRRRLTLGKYPVITIADARRAARKALGQVAAGHDPAGERPQPPAKAYLVGQLIEDYLERYARPRKRSWREDERLLRRDVQPRWEDRPAGEIKRGDVRALLETILARGAPIAANRTRAVIGKMFAWAVDQDLLDSNPCTGLKRVAPEQRRDRVLTEKEIHLLWWALEAEDPSIRDAMRLLLLTAQRSSEVKGIRQEQIQGDLWTVPSSITKNKRTHLVPLSRQVLAVLDERRAAGTPLLIESPRRQGEPLSEGALSHAAVRLSRKLGFSFSPHDLRRTAGTYLPSLGVQRFVVSRILNHTDSSVTGVYDLYSYLPEKRAALQAWADHLDTLIDPAQLDRRGALPAVG